MQWKVQIFSLSQEQTVSHVKAQTLTALDRLREAETNKCYTVVFVVFFELVDTVKRVCEEEMNLTRMSIIEYSGNEWPV